MSVYVYEGTRGKSYGFRFWFRNVLHERMVGRTHALAEDAEKRERARLELAAWEGTWGPTAPRLTPWADAVARYQAAKADKRSLRYDGYILTWWTSFLTARSIRYLQEITPEIVDLSKVAMAGEKKGPATMQRHLSILRALCNLAVKRWRILKENPVHLVDWPQARSRVFPVPTPDELRRLIAIADPVIQPLIVAAIYTGLRAGDLLRLTAEDLRERAGWIRGHGSKPNRPVWLPVAGPLQETLDGLHIISGRLFRRPGGTPYSWFPRERWETTRTTAGLPQLRFHDLRHATGTMLAEANVPQRVIQAYLGHSTGKVTERYTRPQEAGLEQAARKLGRRMAPLKRIS